VKALEPRLSAKISYAYNGPTGDVCTEDDCVTWAELAQFGWAESVQHPDRLQWLLTDRGRLALRVHLAAIASGAVQS
jgi:hypothetical protein